MDELLYGYRKKNTESMIALIQQCFQITSLFREHDSHILSIAKSLSVIPYIKVRNIKDELRDEMIEIENNLDKHLRGFSVLLDSILLEHNIKIDLALLIDEIPPNFKPVAHIFYEFHLHLEAYDGLYLAFNADSCEAEALLFLRALKKIMITGFAITEHQADREIAFYLKNFAKNKALLELVKLEVDYANVPMVIEFCSKYHQYAQTILTAFLCIMSQGHLILDDDYKQKLNCALLKANFIELESFIESGFIAVPR